MWNTYYTVSTLDEAVRLLAERREKVRIVAGATDLIIELERGVRRGLEALIDITRVPGANAITLDDAGWIHLGPLTTHNDCAASELIQTRALPLAQACWEVGAPQIRNRATVAGNLITASPANDTITPLMALEAVVTLRSARGERRVPLREFYTGVRRTVMEPDELLTDIAFPALPADERGLFLKLALRRAQAISVVNVAVIVQRDQAGSIQRARIALGSVAPTIVRATGAEAFLINKTLTPGAIAQAGELAQAAARPISDVRGPAEYRTEMVKVLTVRALRALAAGQERGMLPERPVVLSDRRPRTADGGRSAAVGGPISTTINGRAYTVTGANDKTLLRMLREDCGLIGTKEGCAEGECGACTVFLDGAAVMACLVPAPRAHGAEIVTVEGLAALEPDGRRRTADGGVSDATPSAVNRLHPLQRAFIETGAVQCGYCTPGFIMAGAKLLEERSHPNKNEIEQALTGNLCRCTGYYKILAALEKASQTVE